MTKRILRGVQVAKRRNLQLHRRLVGDHADAG